jgi:hydroxyacylglutathione hydrolase
MTFRAAFRLAPMLVVACGDPSGSPADGSSGAVGSSDTSAPSSSTVTSDGSTTAAETTTAPATTSGAPETSTDAGGDTSTGEARPCAGELPTAWPDGLDCSVPEVAVHRYDDDTFILRQSLCTSFEGPFLYLLFGEDRVLLEDTGAGGIDVAGAVGGVIEEWLAEHGRDTIELVVVNSHAHGDHVAGNPMFMGLPGVTVVTPSVAGVSDFFGIDDWPEQVVQYDLGGRVIDVIPIPGHQTSHIALFDHGTGWLLTGDTLYPGRLYIDDFAAYVDSIGRLVDSVPADAVCNVMGTHVEMTDVPGVDFDFGADEHPGEHALPLDYDHLLELRAAVEAMGSPQIEIHDDFIIYYPL